MTRGHGRSGGRLRRVRRLLADLRNPATRGDALRRVRRRAASAIGRRISGADSDARKGLRGEAAWPRVVEAVAGGAAATGGQGDSAAVADIVQLAREHRLEAVFAQSIAEGQPLTIAVCRTAAALAETGEWHDWNAAWSLTEGVGRLAGGAEAAALGRCILHHRRREFARAWAVVRDLGDEVLATHVPIEAVDGALASGTAAGRARARSVGKPRPTTHPAVLVDIAGRFLAVGERGTAAAAVTELGRRTEDDLDPRRRRSLELIRGWLAAGQRPVPPGAITLGVLAYRTPDHVLTSGNLGDAIQSLALVGNIVRFSRLRLTGDDGLGELARELQGRIRLDLRVVEPEAAVHLVLVDRDFSSESNVPEGTWLVAFGWHMHALYDLRYDFPYHPNIRPLLVSFHVNRLDMLSPDAIAYLRRYGPVGCRDWNTVFLLLSAGVDAFFTGCLTTTVDALFPSRATAYHGRGAVGVIDQPVEASGGGRRVRSFSHQSDTYRSLGLTEALRAADTALAGYQRDLDRAVTGRLHAYLPLTALGVPVEFRTTSPGDVRYAGLTGLRPGDPRLDEMRGGIRELLAAAFERILAGAGEDEVYAAWRDLTRDRVTTARAMFEATVAAPAAEMDVAAAVAACRRASRRFGPHDAVDRLAVSEVALSFDQNLTLAAAVLIESIITNASGPVRFWILCRGIYEAYQAWLGRAFPDVPITFLPCDGVSYGPTGRPRRVPARITVSTMDRLLLPGLLDDVARVVYLDVDTLMLGDVAELARVDLGGRPVAACDSNVSEASEWQRAGRRLPERAATELRRRMGFQHGFGQPALNAGVLVMDLDRMRRDDFMTTSIGLVEEYGLHDQDTMLAYAGPDRLRLDPAWNAMPVLADAPQPKLIHWASFAKPWDEPLTYARHLWQEHAARLRARAGAPPAAAASTQGVSPTDAPLGTLPNPEPVAPAASSLGPAAERAIRAVLDEHLSYLEPAALRTLASVVEDVEAGGIEGIVVEAGTALGGSAIVMAAAKAPRRRMKVFDVFGMIPPPSERDGQDVHRRYATIVRGTSKGLAGETYYGYRPNLLAEVTASFARLGLPIDSNGIELIRGPFEETIALDEPVAVAHLDGDWYASTLACLTRIAPRLAVGGRLVIDDYDTWSGCRTAVDEYFAGRTGFRFERRERLHVVRVSAAA